MPKERETWFCAPGGQNHSSLHLSFPAWNEGNDGIQASDGKEALLWNLPGHCGLSLFTVHGVPAGAKVDRDCASLGPGRRGVQGLSAGVHKCSGSTTCMRLAVTWTALPL